MLRSFLAPLALLALSSCAATPPVARAAPTFATPAESQAVMAAVRQWLDAFESRDGKTLTALTHPDGVSYVLNELPRGPRLRTSTNREDLVELVKPGPPIKEHLWNPVVMVRGALAHVWGPFSFDVNGRRTHCGMNSLSLAKVDGRWMMTNASWTVEPPSACAALGEPVASK